MTPDTHVDAETALDHAPAGHKDDLRLWLRMLSCARLIEADFAVDYVELRDAETLAAVADLHAPARLLAAARIGRTRLIDNLPVAPPPATSSPPR